MIQKIEVLAADVDMTLSSKGSPLPEITIQALKELHDKRKNWFGNWKRNHRNGKNKRNLLESRLRV